jgi:branched-chain amino acid transport system substrate-binding protein
VQQRGWLRPAQRFGAFACASVLVLAACNGDDADAPTVAEVTTTTTTTVAPRADDGVLVIGVLLPTTGGAAQLGGPMINAVRLAADRINDAGGVNGSPVELVEVDEGGSVATAGLGFDTLIAEGVDAIVGPASSIAALGELSSAVSAGVLTCSPTASALALDDFPDNGLFFRTVPSDSLQAIAIAQVLEQTGATSVAIGFLDDSYGRGLLSAVDAAVAARNLEVTSRVGFTSAETDLARQANALFDGEPGVIAILADADAGARLLAAIGAAAPAGTPPPIIVNDALRSARSSQLIVDLPDRIRTRIAGIAPLAVPPETDLAGPYAAHAFDCVKLIALAAVQAGSDSPVRIASQMASVSDGGFVCRSFATCVERMFQGLQIDYTGPSGSTRLSSRTGNPTQARFEVFTFDDDGRDVPGATFEASSL